MDIENTVVVRLKNIANQLDRVMAGLKAEMDKHTGEHKNVSVIQGRIILHLLREEKKGEVLQKDIETFFHIRSSTAAIVLGRMEKNGLITRELSPDDVRKKRKAVSLTKKARKLHSVAQTEIENAERRVTRGLNEKDIARLVKLLDKIAENIS